MAEWSNAAVLKTVDLNGSGGSNPSLSAEKWLTGICKPLFLFNIPKNIPFFEFRSQADLCGYEWICADENKALLDYGSIIPTLTVLLYCLLLSSSSFSLFLVWAMTLPISRLKTIRVTIF